MKKILILVLMGFMLNLSAISTDDVYSAGFGDLTTQEQAEVVKIVADKKANKSIPLVTNVDEAQKWVDLGSSIGKGLASSAAEVGMAVNEFSATGVGQLTMFLIIFHIIGSTILGILASLVILVFGLTFTTVILNRQHGWRIEYDEKTGKQISKKRDALDGETSALFWVAYLIILVASSLLLVVS